MLTTLWVMTVASVVALAAVLVGRRAVNAGSARVELERARWKALGCERRTQAAIDSVLHDAPTYDEAARIWRVLPTAISGSALTRGCAVTLEAVGSRLDVNTASLEMIVNLLNAVGMGDHAAELADALADWRDMDSVASPLGAEQSWYAAQSRLTPRNGPLADVGEIRRVRGFEEIPRIETLVSTDPGRVSLATAPVEVLMAVPGITQETAEAIVEMQAAGTPVSDLLAVTKSISRESASILASRYTDVVRLTTPDPEAWLVRVRVARGLPAVAVELEWRVVRTGKRCLVSQTRSRI